MEFNVAQLLKQPTGNTRQYEINENLDDLDPELVIQAPIKGKVKFTKIPKGILVTGIQELNWIVIVVLILLMNRFLLS